MKSDLSPDTSIQMETLPTTSPFGPTLETQRLILRPPVVEDFDGYCAFHADEIAMKHLGGVMAPSVVWRTMMSQIGMWAVGHPYMFSVFEKASGQWIGRVGANHPLEWPCTEVGWGILSSHFGKGLAFEAAVVSMDWVIERFEWDFIGHMIAPENVESQKLAVRLGSMNHGPSRLPEPHSDKPIEMWGQSAADWKACQKSHRG